MTEEIKKDLTHFLSEEYNDENWETKKGKNVFNGFIEKEEYKITFFSLGNMQGMPNSFMLIQCKTLSIDRNVIPGLGSADWGAIMTFNVYIESAVTGFDAGMKSDIYLEALSKSLQKFCFHYKKYPVVNPRAKIDKYYISSGKGNTDFNSITKLIVSGDLSFTTKTSELTLKEYE